MSIIDLKNEEKILFEKKMEQINYYSKRLIGARVAFENKLEIKKLNEFIKVLDDKLKDVELYHLKNKTTPCNETQIGRIDSLFRSLTDGRTIHKHEEVAYLSIHQANDYIIELEDMILNKQKLATEKQVELIHILFDELETDLNIEEIFDFVDMTAEEASVLIKNLKMNLHEKDDELERFLHKLKHY